MDTNYRILVVDDEQDLLEILKFNLETDGYLVDTANSAEEALSMNLEHYDLLLLDVMMGGMSGFAMARKLKAEPATKDIPIIFLTARDTENDTVTGFNLGADDYISKPFSNMELLMRVKAILRRTMKNTENDSLIPFQDALLDTVSQCIRKDGETIPLTYTEFAILKLLVSHRKKIYSLDNIYESVWKEEPVGDSTIMVHIKNIRRKLGDDSRNPRYIRTAWGKGYYVE